MKNIIAKTVGLFWVFHYGHFYFTKLTSFFEYTSSIMPFNIFTGTILHINYNFKNKYFIEKDIINYCI